MTRIAFLAARALAFLLCWIVSGAAIGLAVALLLEAFGTTAALYTVIAVAVIALIVGAIDCARGI